MSLAPERMRATGRSVGWGRSVSADQAAPRILVMGIGNELMRDDGVGVHAVRLLRDQLPEGVVAADVGTALLDSLDLLGNADLVLAIDAMLGGGAPGTLYTLGIGDLASDECPVSLHQMGLTQVIAFLAPGERPSVTTLGIEPEKIELGTELTATLHAALPKIVRTALTIVGEWSKDPPVRAP